MSLPDSPLELSEKIQKDGLVALLLYYEAIKTKEEIDRIEGSVYLDVCNEKTADGKPKYSNEKLREIEVKTRLDNDAVHRDLISKHRETLLTEAKTKLEIEHATRMFRIRFGLRSVDSL